MSISSYTSGKRGTQYYFVNNLNNSAYSLSQIETDATSSAFEKECTQCTSNGRSTLPPYYTLGPAPYAICPY